MTLKAINPHRRFYTLVEAVGARRELPGSVLWRGERAGSSEPGGWVSPGQIEKWRGRIHTEAWRVTEGEEPRDPQFRWKVMG